jgi:hypothetical protein
MTANNCPTEAQIRSRAYQIYLQHGAQANHEMDDWLQAEYELMQLPIRKIAELHPPEQRKSGTGKPALVSLVHAALFLGAGALPHLKG